MFVEEPFRDLLGQQGLAHARRPDEEEDADRPVLVLEPGPRAADRAGDALHGLLLTHDAAGQVVAQRTQARGLVFRDPLGGDARHVGDDAADEPFADLHGRSCRIPLQVGPRARLVERIDRLVRETAPGDVAPGELHAGA